MKTFGIVMKVCGVVVWAVTVFLLVKLLTGIKDLEVLMYLSDDFEKYVYIACISITVLGFMFGALLFGFGLAFSKVEELRKNQEAMNGIQRDISEEQLRLTNAQIEADQWQRKVEVALAARKG